MPKTVKLKMQLHTTIIYVKIWTGCVGGDWCGTSVEFRWTC